MGLSQLQISYIGPFPEIFLKFKIIFTLYQIGENYYYLEIIFKFISQSNKLKGIRAQIPLTSIDLDQFNNLLILIPKSENTMQEQLQFIEDFANTIANTFKQFAQLCRVHIRRTQQNRPEFAEMQAQLIEERKKRIQLQEKIRQKISGNSGNNDSLLPGQERKKPNNAFALFVADQRDKLLKLHPTLDFVKITTLAAIKWKKMTEQQRLTYQKKFDQMSKLYEDQAYLNKTNKNTNNLDEHGQTLVKRQFAEEQEDNNNRVQEEEHAEVQAQQNQNMNEGARQQQQLAGTMLIHNQNQNEATMQMIEEQKETKKNLQNILDLFHTPVPRNEYIKSVQNGHTDQQVHLQEQPKQTSSKVQQTQNVVPPIALKVFDPSIQIIEQVVIDPTIQEQHQ